MNIRWTGLIPLPCMVAVFVGCTGYTARSADQPEGSTITEFSYDLYADLLSDCVNAAGYVDYASLQKRSGELDAFCTMLAALDRTTYEAWSHEAQFAFWINAYNACTLKAVVDHYPVKSIKDIGTPLRSVWDKLKFPVTGQSYSLNDMEHRVLRETFKDPRLHMAINCASVGCPPLSNRPYQADTLNEHLASQTRQFLSNEAAFRIDHDRGVVYLSRIFDWFGEDFLPNNREEPPLPGLDEKTSATIRFIGRHLKPDEASFLTSRTPVKVKYLEYDWRLNKQ